MIKRDTLPFSTKYTFRSELFLNNHWLINEQSAELAAQSKRRDFPHLRGKKTEEYTKWLT